MCKWNKCACEGRKIAANISELNCHSAYHEWDLQV